MTTSGVSGTGPTSIPEAAVPWARQPISADPRATQRIRRMVDGLPAWDPLPPGEILVQRGRQP